MSLFPFTDIIPQVCFSLTYKDIHALLLVDITTAHNLRPLAKTRQRQVSMHGCTFDISEQFIAGAVMSTRVTCKKVTLNVSSGAEYVLRDIAYPGDVFTGCIYIDRTSDLIFGSNYGKIGCVVDVKNNIAAYHAEAIKCLGSPCVRYVAYDHVPIHNMEYIAKLLRSFGVNRTHGNLSDFVYACGINGESIEFSAVLNKQLIQRSM